jgi:hypothetical protein
LAGYLLRGGLTFLGVADGHDDLGSFRGQLSGCHRAQPTIGSGNDDGAPGK